jgi:hypothetical protein
MVKYRKKIDKTQEIDNATTITLLIKSTKLTIKEIEKITSLLLETLSTSLDGKTMEIESRDIRATSSISEGSIQSISTKFSF